MAVNEQAVHNFIEGFDADVEDFTSKAAPGGFLRTATISHIRGAFHFTDDQAEAALDAYIKAVEDEIKADIAHDIAQDAAYERHLEDQGEGLDY